MEKCKEKGLRIQDNVGVIALKDGIALREWIERMAQEVSFKTIRCATFTVSAPGLQWIRRLTRDRQVQVKLLSDVGQTDSRMVSSIMETRFASGEIECRTASARPGPVRDEDGIFHPKILILEDVAAVVGSVNLTGKGLGLGIQPHNIEMSVGLSGISLQPTIKQLVEVFDRWWKDGRTLRSNLGDKKEKENQYMAQPEYVVFRDRPLWGIAQFQNEGSGLFGQEQWLAVSDISPVDPEHRPARIQVPRQFINEVNPEPWDTPATQLAHEGIAAVSNSKEHFRRLAAYWLQAENRSGQLDSLPVLQLRHQASLVEYLSGPDAPREMLIADEVGLGKTVEMGLLLERLKAAKPDLRVLYVAPGSLVTNVADEFKNMGLDDFWVFANRSLEEKYPPARLGREEHDRCVVASLHRLGFGSNPESYLRGTQWDVVIADECHKLRMYGSGDSQKAQKWFRLFEQIIGHHMAEDGRVYFLSGTPHQGNREVFLNLISLMRGLGRRVSQEEQQRAIDGRVIYRIKEEIRDWDNRPVFPRRNVRQPCYADIPPEYNNLLADIAEFFDWVQRNDSLANNKRRAIGFVKSHALQYAASSPKAGFAFLLRRYLRHFANETNEETLLKWVSLLIPYRSASSKQKPEHLLAELLKSVKEDESDYVEEDDDLNESVVGPAGADKVHQEEKQRLSQLLRQYASFLSSPEAEAKFNELTQLLEEADEPFVVFAQSVDTVFEIKRHVEQRGIPCCVIVGGQDPSIRRTAIKNFTKPGRLGRRVLVSSAAGGEGINLQIARRLIHFDLPWNPMVLEQRIGRVHRIGTIDTIIVDTILLKDSREAEIYLRLTARLLHIVTALTEYETKQDEYFRRIMAGIPLEILRNLFSSQITDDAAIGAAVEAGRNHVKQVDAELRRHRVEQLSDEKGLATMEHLVTLLEDSGKITATRGLVKYNEVRYDPDTDSFRSEEKEAIRYYINDDQMQNRWVVFDREAAALSPDVSRRESGGINHPIIACALQSLRTAENIEDMPNFVLGIGTYDKEYLAYFSDGADEPVVLLSYLVARLRGEHFFNHELRVFPISPSNPEQEEVDRELVEDIIWTNLQKDDTEIPHLDLDQSFLKEVSSQDVHIREKLGSEVRDEEGRWRGAVWPLAATILLPTA